MFCFWNSMSQHNPGWPGTLHVDKAGLEHIEIFQAWNSHVDKTGLEHTEICVAQNSPCRPGWHWTHRNMPDSAVRELGLNERTTSQTYDYFIIHVYLSAVWYVC